MPYFNFPNIKISAIASAVPKLKVSTYDYVDAFGKEAVDKFIETTGVKEHRTSLPHQTASDLGFVAAKQIIERNNIDPKSIGALVFGAHSTDYRRPATACVLHKRLNLGKECAAYDISLGCSAFVYAVASAASLMASSDIERALVIVGETMTKMVFPEDKSSSMLFGDAGGAALLEKTQDGEEGITALLRTDGEGYQAIIAPAGGFRNMDASKETFLWPDGNPRTLYNTYMKGTDVFSFTITDVPRSVKDFLRQSGTEISDYDCLPFHQANMMIQRQLAKKLKIDMAKMPTCLDKFGNTSAAAIPLTVCNAFGQEAGEEKMKCLMAGFGVGLSWGVVSATINTSTVLPIIETDEIFTEGIINSPTDLSQD